MTDFTRERDVAGTFPLEMRLPNGSSSVDARDIENCFLIFLGRKPALDELRQELGALLVDVLGDLLARPEFLSTVLPPLLLREPLPHGAFDPTPPLPLLDWAQTRLPIQNSTRFALGGVRTWAQCLELLLADSTLCALSPSLAEANVQQLLSERLEKEPLLAVQRSVTGVVDSFSAFEVRGWAVDTCNKSAPVTLELYADGAFLGSTTCNQSRPDVADAIGGHGNYGFSFTFSHAHRAILEAGRNVRVVDSVTKAPIGESFLIASDSAQSADALFETRKEIAELKKILERIEARLPEISHRASIPAEAYAEYWERFYRPSHSRLHHQREQAARFLYRPLISIVMPTYNSDTRLLSKAIDSVRAQSYDHWELLVSDDASNRDELRSLLGSYAHDTRIHWIENASRSGIAINTNRAIEASRGEYIAFLDHDDEFAPDALFHVALALQRQQYGLLYSDEDRIEEDETRRCIHHTPFFKPAFDPDLLLSINYICHLVVLRRDVLTAAGALRPGYDGAQDHDLLLRTTASLDLAQICHLPRVLYHWRVTPGSVSSTPQHGGAIQQNIVAAVADHLAHRGLSAQVEAHNDPLGASRHFATRVRWSLPSPAPSLSILIATRDRVELLRPCVDSVLKSLDQYPGSVELLILDNDSVEPDSLHYLAALARNPRVRILPFHGPFNYSAINNAGARAAKGDVLIFLNNDTVVFTPDWCAELAAHAMRADVGAVGARLLYADGTIQHAGVVLGVQGVAGHECVGEMPQAGGYFGRSQLLRSAAAVTGACLATRRELFLQLAGFDELHLKVAFNDVDYCMKVRQAGLRVVFNPFAVLYHLESKSRGREVTTAQQQRHRDEALAFRERWGQAEVPDPYYNTHFERYARPFERLRPPPEPEEASA